MVVFLMTKAWKWFVYRTIFFVWNWVLEVLPIITSYKKEGKGKGTYLLESGLILKTPIPENHLIQFSSKICMWPVHFFFFNLIWEVTSLFKCMCSTYVSQWNASVLVLILTAFVNTASLVFFFFLLRWLLIFNIEVASLEVVSVVFCRDKDFENSNTQKA